MPIITRYDFLRGALTALLTLALFAWYAAKKRLSYPPGPRRLPIIGNLFNMPSREEWVTYKKWSEEYGMNRDAITLGAPSSQRGLCQVLTSYMPM